MTDGAGNLMWDIERTHLLCQDVEDLGRANVLVDLWGYL